MLKFIRKAYLKLINIVERYYYRWGRGHGCNICRHQFRRFTKFRGGVDNKFIRTFDIIGSNVDEFGCPYCRAFDRERHLVMFFDKLGFWDKISNASILHFAPEKKLIDKIKDRQPSEYIQADLNPKNESITRIDITAIQYSDRKFDLVIANHILEHIPDYRLALKEINRVLKSGGQAILQTPLSRRLIENFEISDISSERQRAILYGQSDHLRIFSESRLFADLLDVGFALKIIKNGDLLTNQDSHYYGVNKREDLILVTKIK